MKKKISLLITSLVLSLLVFIPVFIGTEYSVTSLELSQVDEGIKVEGTTTEDIVAVAIMVYNSNEQLVLNESTEVNDSNEFSYILGGLASDTYTVKVANYSGGAYVTDTIVYSNDCTVTFMDGESLYDTKVVTCGTKVSAPTTAPTKEGSSFAGWFLGDEPFDFNTVINDATELHANWNENTPVYVVHTVFFGDGGSYTVAFDTEDAEELAKQNVDKTSSLFLQIPEGNELTLEATASEGNHFVGWYSVHEVGGENWEQDDLLSTNTTYTYTPEDSTLYIMPVFAENSGTTVHTVNFVTSEFSGDTVDVNDGEQVERPEDPEREGHTFLGWFTDQDTLEDEYDFSTPVTDDFDLFAKWEINKYTVRFMDGESVYDSKEIEYDSLVTPPENDPEKEGHTFNGWFLGEDEYDFENETVKDNLDLEAQWEVEEYEFSLDANGGTLHVDLGDTINYGEEIYLVLTDEEVTAPLGKYLDSIEINGENYELGSSYTVTGDTAIKLIWATYSYTVTFNSNGGSNVNNATVDYGNAVSVPAAPSKQGYNFNGWLLNSAEYDFSTPVTSDIELVASWSIQTFNVRFYNGTSLLETKVINYNDKVTAIDSPSREGYRFLGWYKDGVLYDFSSKVTSNTTLTAEWKIVTYEVLFNTNGGSNVDAQIIDYGKTATKPADPTRAGYTFVGWFLEGEEFDFDANVYANFEVTAKWTAKETSKEVEKINETTSEKALETLVENVTSGTEVAELKEEVKEAIEEAKENNVDMQLVLTANLVSEDDLNLTEEEKAAIENKVGEDDVFVGFFDVDLTLVIDNDEYEITKLNEPIEVTIDAKEIIDALPEVEKGYNRTYKIVRLHDGIADIIDATLNEDGTLTFKTDRFSTYTVIYNDVLAPSPQTGDVIYVFAIIGLISMIGLIATIILKKKNI